MAEEPSSAFDALGLLNTFCLAGSYFITFNNFLLPFDLYVRLAPVLSLLSNQYTGVLCLWGCR